MSLQTWKRFNTALSTHFRAVCFRISHSWQLSLLFLFGRSDYNVCWKRHAVMYDHLLSLTLILFFFLPVCLLVAIMLKDDYFVRGAGLPGRFKAEKVEFHWGPSNGSEGSEHSVNGRRYPVEVRTVCQVFTYHEVSLIWEKVIKFLKRCRLWCGWDGSLDVYSLFLQGKENIYLGCWPCVSRRDTYFP